MKLTEEISDLVYNENGSTYFFLTNRPENYILPVVRTRQGDKMDV